MPDEKDTGSEDFLADALAAEDDEIEIIYDVDEDEGAARPASVADELEHLDPVVAELQEQVAQFQEERERLREQYLRKLAEFDNFRKRVEREREEMQRTAGEGVVRELVPVLDNFERALQHSSDSDAVAFRQGVEMIAKQQWDVLQRLGLEMVDPLGQPFEPEFHEAVQRVEDSGEAPGIVVAVLAKGYLFHGRLLRPAIVSVAVEPTKPTEESPPEVGEGEEEGVVFS